MSTTPSTPAGAVPGVGRATWREWLGLALLSLPMLTMASDLSVLFVAMPSIGDDLQPGTSQMLWILHVYGFVIAGLLITMGRLGDRIGRRRLLLIGAGSFAVFSGIASWSTSAEMLIVIRALLGVAGATLMPSTYSLLRPMFPHATQRRYAIAVMVIAFAVGTASGPLIGGVLLAHFWWGSLFLANVPPLVLLLLFGAFLLPEYRTADTHRLDLASVGLSMIGLVAVIYGLQEAATHGVQTLHVLSVAAGLLLAVVFVHRQRRLTSPLLDLRLFTNRRFSTSVAMVLLTAIAVMGSYYLFTQYLQWVAGLTPLQAGLWTLPYVVALGLGSLIAPMLARRVRHAYTIGAGLAVAALGLATVAITGEGVSLHSAVAAMGAAGFGQGAAMALGSDLIISTTPARQAGSAAAVQEISGELGTALGVAVGGGIGALVYRHTLTDTIPGNIPTAATNDALDGVPGALAAAEELGTPLAAQLLNTAREAYIHALQTGFGVSATILAPVAVAVIVLLRRTDTPDSDPADTTTTHAADNEREPVR